MVRTSGPAVPMPSDAVTARRPQPVDPTTRPPDDVVEDAPEHRRRTSRHVRHESRTTLHVLAADADALEDADLLCPHGAHDLGRKASPAPRRQAKPGRRGGFKVWKTPFWKRRRLLWAEQNAAARRLSQLD